MVGAADIQAERPSAKLIWSVATPSSPPILHRLIVHFVLERVDLKRERAGRPSAGSFDAL